MAKMRMFLRETTVGREPLAVAMSSVRVGERVLQIGVDDPRIAHAIANKTGITGLATIVVPNESAMVRVKGVAGEGSSSADVRIDPLDRLAIEDAVYDVVVVHNVEGLLTGLDPAVRVQALRESRRVLRPGGRIVVFDRGKPTGLRAMLGGGPKRDRRYESEGGSLAVLQGAGFSSVHLLSEREGYRFIEAIKPR